MHQINIQTAEKQDSNRKEQRIKTGTNSLLHVLMHCKYIFRSAMLFLYTLDGG